MGIPTLYGMSALGTKVYFYTHDKETRSILLKRVKDGNLVIDTAPAERWVVYISGWHDILWRWSLDMMTPEGERQLREIVDRVKVMCTQLLKRSEFYMVQTLTFAEAIQVMGQEVTWY